MTNKTKIIIGVGSAIALVASYLIYKKMSSDDGEVNPKKKGEENTAKKGEENTATNNSECKRYVVSNVSNSVNVRSTPSTSLKEITTLNKNSVVSAKPSSVNGWNVKTIEGNTSTEGVREGFKTQYLTRTLEIGKASKGKIFHGYWKRNFTEQEFSQIVYDEEKDTFVMKNAPSIAGKQLKKTSSVGGFDPYNFLRL